MNTTTLVIGGYVESTIKIPPLDEVKLTLDPRGSEAFVRDWRAGKPLVLPDSEAPGKEMRLWVPGDCELLSILEEAGELYRQDVDLRHGPVVFYVETKGRTSLNWRVYATDDELYASVVYSFPSQNLGAFSQTADLAYAKSPEHTLFDEAGFKLVARWSDEWLISLARAVPGRQLA